MLNKILTRCVWNRVMRSTTLATLRLLPIKKGRVMCLCWKGSCYGCNPQSIAETIVLRDEWRKSFEVWFAFVQPEAFAALLPTGIHAVQIGSLDYFHLLATSQFIISNIHLTGEFFPYKKCGQQYLFTGHGASGIKKIEFDTDSLPSEYMKMAEEDTSRMDLFLSCSEFRSRVIRSAYRYQGEILEKGTPRNDAYVRSLKSLTDEHHDLHYLIYTPTFRGNGRRDVYGFDVDRVVAALEQRFGGEWYVRISSHPNMRGYYREIYDFSHPRMIDVGNEDLQPLLLTSAALITDYSSAEMDFSLTGRPVFQLCRDREDYDRGFYINPEDLPFPYATNDDGLVQNILAFDADKYAKEVDAFNRDVIGLKETGHAAEGVVEWMLSKM